MKKEKTHQIGRSAITGQFKPVGWARAHKSTAVVEEQRARRKKCKHRHGVHEADLL